MEYACEEPKDMLTNTDDDDEDDEDDDEVLEVDAEDDDEDGEDHSSHSKQRGTDLRKGFLVLLHGAVWKILKISRVGDQPIQIGMQEDPEETMDIEEEEVHELRAAYMNLKSRKKTGEASARTKATEKPKKVAKKPAVPEMDGLREIVVLLSHPKLPGGMGKDLVIPESPYLRTTFDASAILAKFGTGGDEFNDSYGWPAAISDMTRESEKQFKMCLRNELFDALRPSDCSLRVYGSANSFGYEQPGERANSRRSFIAFCNRRFFQSFFVEGKLPIILVVEVDGEASEPSSTPEDAIAASIELPKLPVELRNLPTNAAAATSRPPSSTEQPGTAEPATTYPPQTRCVHTHSKCAWVWVRTWAWAWAWAWA